MATATTTSRRRPTTTDRGPTRSGAGLVIRLSYSWPLDFMFVGFGLWWVLGLHSFVWQLMAVPLLLRLVGERRTLRAPRGFGLWLLFLGWNALSVLGLERSVQFIGFGYRFALYLSATMVFLFVYNAPRHLLPTRKVYGLAMGFWITVVVGGWLGVLVPNGGFSSVVELLAPRLVATDEYVRTLVHPQFAQVQTFLGFPLGRPQAPFAYTNHWGSTFALLIPVVMLGWAQVNPGRGRLALQLGLTASMIPAIVSLNRGLFLSLGAALVYASARSGNVGANARRALLAVAVLLVVLLAVTPLGDLASQRQDNQHSNDGRATLYDQSIDVTRRSPLLGYGAPQEVEGDRILPQVGTQGQFWMVMVSHGFVGLALYLGFLLTLWRNTRRLGAATAVAHLCMTVMLVQMFVYDLVAAPHHLVFMVVAAALRDAHQPETAVDREPDEDETDQVDAPVDALEPVP